MPSISVSYLIVVSRGNHAGRQFSLGLVQFVFLFMIRFFTFVEFAQLGVIDKVPSRELIVVKIIQKLLIGDSFFWIDEPFLA